MTAEIRRHPDAETLAADVASALLARLEESQSSPGAVTHVALTGGSIAEAIHREVARRAADASVDWSRVALWWGDERFVARDSSDRNAHQAREDLLDRVALDPGNVHEVPASDDVPDVEAAAASYADEVRSQGAGEFDLVMLGVGPDGHVASLFPGRPELQVTGAVTVAVRESPKPPPERVSLTFEALARARAVWFVVNGEGKAEAVARALADEGTIEETPARGVHGRDETVWWIDEEAASHLPR